MESTESNQRILVELVSTQRSLHLETRQVWRGMASGIRVIHLRRGETHLREELRRSQIQLESIRKPK